jgi:hypothetical protein
MSPDTIEPRNYALPDRLARAQAMAVLQDFIVRRRAEQLIAAIEALAAKVAEIAAHAPALINARDKMLDLDVLDKRVSGRIYGLQSSGEAFSEKWRLDDTMEELAPMYRRGELPDDIVAALRIALPDRCRDWAPRNRS